jgi:tetratricopeptide (TPR) repeat protein
LFALVRLNQLDTLDEAARRLLSEPGLYPAILYTAGNVYSLVSGRESKADELYSELKTYPGWKAKADFYRSTFCYQQGLFKKAVEYGLKAQNLVPVDPSINYHLSLCYRALGEKERALDVVRHLPSTETDTWFQFYRFTLERDSGKYKDALKTLLEIPRDYFQDPEELNEAIRFAKDQQDFILLKHLNRR